MTVTEALQSDAVLNARIDLETQLLRAAGDVSKLRAERAGALLKAFTIKPDTELLLLSHPAAVAGENKLRSDPHGK